MCECGKVNLTISVGMDIWKDDAYKKNALQNNGNKN